MNNPFIEVVTSKIFIATWMAWLVAQSIKIAITLALTKKFNFKLLLSTGGMPSAHAASVSALAISVGIIEGFSSPLCVVSIVFAYITMFDAQGVRRHAGSQAAILNKMVEELYFNKGIKPERLKELLGHTPVEVFAGCLLGVVLALLMSK